MIDTFTTPTVGLTSRQGERGEENDDHVAWFTVARPDRQCMIHVGVVADGVTSTSGGAQASRIATEAIEAALRELPDPQETLSEWLAGAIRSANEEILFEGKQNPTWQGMSTTVVLAALAGNRLYVLHLGDSRAYLHRNGHLHQLTTDHTWAQAAVNAGTLTAAEAAHHPGRNQLQRYLGGSKQINVARGVLAPESGRPEEYLLVAPGDRVLLCSDGIYHRLKAATLAEMIGQEADPQRTVDALVAAAVAQGEIDDITALLFTVPAQPENPFAVEMFPAAAAPKPSGTDDEVTVKSQTTPLVQQSVVAKAATVGSAHRRPLQPPSIQRWSIREIGLITAAVFFILMAIYLLRY